MFLEMDELSTYVYFKHDSKFVLGKVVDIGNGQISVETLDSAKNAFSVAYLDAYPTEYDQEKDVDDLCKNNILKKEIMHIFIGSLIYLNDVTLLKNCDRRYKRNVIYTYLANILVSINPYEDIADLYSVDNIRKYKNKSIGVLPPHIFAIGMYYCHF